MLVYDDPPALASYNNARLKPSSSRSWSAKNSASLELKNLQKLPLPIPASRASLAMVSSTRPTRAKPSHPTESRRWRIEV